MFWLRNRKSNFQRHTINWRPGFAIDCAKRSGSPKEQYDQDLQFVIQSLIDFSSYSMAS